MAKNRGGRPTKYDSSFIQKVDEYLKTCGREQTKLPKLEDFAELLGVDDDTLVEWRKIHPEFSAACKRIERFQKGELIDDGLFGGKEVNASMAIFLLKVNHGMIETSKLDVTSKGEKIVGFNYLAPDGNKGNNTDNKA